MVDPIAQLCQIIAEVLRDAPELEQTDLVSRVERAIAANPQLEVAFRANPAMLQTNWDGSTGFQTVVQGGTVYVGGTQYVLSDPEKFRAAFEAVLQKIQTPEAKTFDFRCYLQSILDDEKYRKWQTLYIPLRVERVKPKEEHKGGGRENSEQQEQVEQWDVLAGLRNYTSDHVLLMGKPGSGKSTVLRQLLWEEAQNALAVIERGETNFKIPVLIELRDRKEEAIVNRIHKVLRQARLDVAAIEELLLEGRFLLLFDGLNEIPTPAIWSELQDFQDERDFRKNPRIFTTRELGIETGLGVETKLTLLPLTEPQMRKFVEHRLSGRAKILLSQLKERLRELAETPLLLKILCDVVKESPEGHLPTNRGELFRQEFARRYQAFKPKRGYVSEDSRRLTEWLLQKLAFEMTQGHSPTDPELQISKDWAIQILQNFLQTQGEANALTKASEYLEDLLEWDLLQVASDTTQIEFHHQLFQEYYAAEYLLRLLPELSDEQFKRDYLNYSKWTEAIALMLALVDAEAVAVKLVKLALNDVDLMLGARLAGEAKREFQSKTVALIHERQLSSALKYECLAATRSEEAIAGLLKALDDQDYYVLRSAAEALGKIGSEAAVDRLLKALTDQDYYMRMSAALALEKIGSEAVVEALLTALVDPDSRVRMSAALALEKIGSEAAVDGLLKALADQDYYVRWRAASALEEIGSEAAVNGLRTALADPDSRVSGSAASALGKIGSEAAVDALLTALNDPDSRVRMSAAEALGKIGSEAAVDALLKALDDQDYYVRRSAAEALGKIGSEAVVDRLLKALESENSDVRMSAAEALGKIGSEVAVDGLLKALDDQDYYVRRSAAEALGKIGSEAAVDRLLKALESEKYDVLSSATEALGRIGGEAAVYGLLKALESQDFDVRRSAAWALRKIGSEAAVDRLLKALTDQDSRVREISAEALGRIGGEAAIDGLLKALTDQDYYMRMSAAEALGKIGSEAAVDGLLKALTDPDSNVRWRAASALGRIGGEAAIDGLLKALTDQDYYMRMSAASALEEIGSEAAVNGLRTALADPDSRVSGSAASALGKIGSEAAVDALLTALNDPDSRVRMSAAEALGKIGSEAAVDALLKALESEDSGVCWSAAKALGEIGSPKHLSALWKQQLNSSHTAYYSVIAPIQSRCNFYNYEIWQEAEAVQKANKEKPVTTTRQMTNVFPNATEVKIFEQIEHYHQASTLPPASSS